MLKLVQILWLGGERAACLFVVTFGCYFLDRNSECPNAFDPLYSFYTIYLILIYNELFTTIKCLLTSVSLTFCLWAQSYRY